MSAASISVQATGLGSTVSQSVLAPSRVEGSVPTDPEAKCLGGAHDCNRTIIKIRMISTGAALNIHRLELHDVKIRPAINKLSFFVFSLTRPIQAQTEIFHVLRQPFLFEQGIRRRKFATKCDVRIFWFH